MRWGAINDLLLLLLKYVSLKGKRERGRDNNLHLDVGVVQHFYKHCPMWRFAAAAGCCRLQGIPPGSALRAVVAVFQMWEKGIELCDEGCCGCVSDVGERHRAE